MSTTSVLKHLITGRTQNLEVFLEVFFFLRKLTISGYFVSNAKNSNRSM